MKRLVSKRLCIESTGYCLRLRTNSQAAIVGFHPSNLFTWHPVQKRSQKGDLTWSEFNWEEVVLYCFLICFPVSENIPLFLSLNKIHAMKYMQGYNYIKCFSLTLFPFSFIWVQIEREILSQKFPITNRFPLSLDTEPGKCYWWNLKSWSLQWVTHHFNNLYLFKVLFTLIIYNLMPNHELKLIISHMDKYLQKEFIHCNSITKQITVYWLSHDIFYHTFRKQS